MSEEERKAIEEAKKQIEEVNNLNDINIFMTDSTTLKTLLKYIEKLEKENEELKELLTLNHYVEKKEIMKDLNYYKDLARCYQGNCVSKDKIRNEIKELEKSENLSIADIYESMKDFAIEVLKELLGE